MFGNGQPRVYTEKPRTTYTTTGSYPVTVYAIVGAGNIISTQTRPLFVSNIWLSHSQPFISFGGEFLGIRSEQDARLWSEQIANYSSFREPVWYGTVTDTLAKMYLNVAVPDSNTNVRISIPDKRLGTLTSLYPDIRSGTQATVRGVSYFPQPRFWTVCMMYTPPMAFPPELAGQNEITVPVSVTIGTNATQVYPIRLLRTPVIAVPDVVSNRSEWEQSGMSAELERQGYRVFYADYAGERTGNFSPTAVPSSVGVSAFTRATVEAKNFYLEQGVYVPRVDVIGHGMGGIFTRTFLQNEVRRFYTLWGSVRRFITLGTPHGGTPLGTYLWSCRDGRATAMQSNNDLLTMLGFPLGSIYRSLGRGDSAFSLLQAMPETPTHTIVSDWKPSAATSPTNNYSFLHLLQTFEEYRSQQSPIDSLFLGRAHNFFADVASQRGGLPERSAAVSYFPNVAHARFPFADTSETLLSSPRVWRRVVELLNTTATASFVNGLPAPPEAWWNTSPAFPPRSPAIPAGSLRIQAAARGQTVIIDTLRTLSIRADGSGTANVRDGLIFIDDLGKGSLTPSGASSFVGTISNIAGVQRIGRKRVSIIARDAQTGGLLIDTTTITLVPRGELEDITTEPCFLSMEAGKTTGQQQIRTKALYGGFWYDVTNSSQFTSYSSTRNTVRINSDGFVTALGSTSDMASADTITIQHGGLQVRIPVKVSGVLTSVRELPFPSLLDTKSTKLSLRLSPQPAANELTVAYTLSDDTEVRFDVVDIRGQQQGTVQCGRQQRGQHRLVLSTEALSQGVYLLQCTVSGSCCRQGVPPHMESVFFTIVR